MCAHLIVGDTCWLVVLSLTLIPAGIAVYFWARHQRQILRRERPLPLARLHAGPVVIAGTLRADRGAAWLEEAPGGSRARLDGGLWPLPPPGTQVVVHGQALGLLPDPRAVGYRDMGELWRVRPDEVRRPGETPLLRRRFDRAPPRLRLLQMAALVLVSLGLLLGVGWPSVFNWCHCVWP